MHTVTRKLAALAVPALAAFTLVAATARPALAGPPREASIDKTPVEKGPGPNTGVVNLNTATEDDLVQLPGVGPSKATAILAWRKKYGSFKRVEDLVRVRGFGRKTFLKLKPHLAVNGPTTFKGKKSAGGDGLDGPGLATP